MMDNQRIQDMSIAGSYVPPKFKPRAYSSNGITFAQSGLKRRDEERDGKSAHEGAHQPTGPTGGNSAEAFASNTTGGAGSGDSAAVVGARGSKLASKPRSKSNVVPRSKLRQSSFSADASALKPLNTHSPVALAAAAAVTGDKIRKLLVAQGPLPIRHITSHLAATIPGFGELSLSKQRRLIIAVLDAPKSEFVKVGWGRWAVEGQQTDRKESLGSRRLTATTHRESISRNLPDSKPPLSPSLGPVEDSAVFSDSDSDDGYESEVEGTDEEDWQAIGPAQLRQTSPREQDAIAALVQLRSN